jgi:hypothetical protein
MDRILSVHLPNSLRRAGLTRIEVLADGTAMYLVAEPEVAVAGASWLRSDSIKYGYPVDTEDPLVQLRWHLRGESATNYHAPLPPTIWQQAVQAAGGKDAGATKVMSSIRRLYVDEGGADKVAWQVVVAVDRNSFLVTIMDGRVVSAIPTL